jgi:hypothetical protein
VRRGQTLQRNKVEIYHTEEIQKKTQRILVGWNVREYFLDSEVGDISSVDL